MKRNKSLAIHDSNSLMVKSGYSYNENHNPNRLPQLENQKPSLPITILDLALI